MNTFLPYSNFSKSAQCLDNKRLGKQRVEAWQIYLSLTQKDYGWKNHPCVKMWEGHEQALLYYGFFICYEWQLRGFKDTMKDKFLNELKTFKGYMYMPFWLGNKKFHDAMKSNLLRKDKAYYSKFGWKVRDNLSYIWGNEK